MGASTLFKPEVFLTVDLEDFRYIRCRELGVSARSGAYYVEKGVDRILNALQKNQPNAQITFFTTGQIARDQSALVKRLHQAGHEIACHTFEHENVQELKVGKFRAVLSCATKYLEDIIGAKVLGFRAPSFRLPEEPEWFFEVLAEQGYIYDSSVLQSERRISPHCYDFAEIPNSQIVEFPVHLFHAAPGVSIRVVGGTYFRFLPTTAIHWLIENAGRKGFCPIIWLHPSDLVDNFSPLQVSQAEQLEFAKRFRLPFEQFVLQQGTRACQTKLAEVLSHYQLKGTMASVALTAISEHGFQDIRTRRRMGASG